MYLCTRYHPQLDDKDPEITPLPLRHTVTYLPSAAKSHTLLPLLGSVATHSWWHPTNNCLHINIAFFYNLTLAKLCALVTVCYTAQKCEASKQVFVNTGGWWSGAVVSMLASIDEVNLRRTRLVLRWATMSPKANSAFHPSGVSKWVPALPGKAKADIVHSVSGCMRDMQVKLWDPFRMRAIT